jgi:hypothetical protein
MVLFLFGNVTFVLLLLWLCIFTVCLCMTTLPEVFPCFSSVVRQMPRWNQQRRGTARTLPNFCVVPCNFCVVPCIDCFVTLSVLFVCICVLNYCHRVATQLQLNISFIISYPGLINRGHINNSKRRWKYSNKCIRVFFTLDSQYFCC